MTETWATSISDLEESIRAVIEKSGGAHPVTITFLDEDDLVGMGVSDPGKAARVKSGARPLQEEGGRVTIHRISNTSPSVGLDSVQLKESPSPLL